MDSPASHRVSRAPCYSGTPEVTEDRYFNIQGYHLLWLLFPENSANTVFVTPFRCPQHPDRSRGLGYSVFARRYWRNLGRFLFLQLLRCVSSLRSLHRPMHSAGDDTERLPVSIGLPHSEIPGLTVARHLPRAYRSLPRPSSPLDTKTFPTYP